MINKINNLFVGEEGQGMTEYGLVLAAIAIGAVMALVALRIQISAFINRISDAVSNSVTAVLPTAP